MNYGLIIESTELCKKYATRIIEGVERDDIMFIMWHNAAMHLIKECASLHRRIIVLGIGPSKIDKYLNHMSCYSDMSLPAAGSSSPRDWTLENYSQIKLRIVSRCPKVIYLGDNPKAVKRMVDAKNSKINLVQFHTKFAAMTK